MSKTGTSAKKSNATPSKTTPTSSCGKNDASGVTRVVGSAKARAVDHHTSEDDEEEVHHVPSCSNILTAQEEECQQLRSAVVVNTGATKKRGLGKTINKASKIGVQHSGVVAARNGETHTDAIQVREHGQKTLRGIGKNRNTYCVPVVSREGMTISKEEEDQESLLIPSTTTTARLDIETPPMVQDCDGYNNSDDDDEELQEEVVPQIQQDATSQSSPGVLLAAESPASSAAAAPPPYQQEDVISAVPVDEDNLELHIRQQINDAAAQAEVVDLEKEMKTEINKVQRRNLGFGCAALIVIGIIVIAVVSSIVRQNNNNQEHNLEPSNLSPDIFATLGSVSRRGYLNCGLSKRDEDVKFHPEFDKMWLGFHGDFCRAIAAAAFDGDVNVTIHQVGEAERWEALRNGTLDVLAVGTPSITDSLHFNTDDEVPATFSLPFLYDGVGLGGVPYYIQRCVTTKGFEIYDDCRSIKVCIIQGSVALEVFDQILHISQIVEVATTGDLYNRFAQGCCNMIATDWANERAEVTIRTETGYTGEYAVDEGLFSRQPYAMATRKVTNQYRSARTKDSIVTQQNDPQLWSEFVDWVVQSLIAAEWNGITQSTANLTSSTEVFGPQFQNAFRNAIGAVGNYGEIYNRNLGYVFPRDWMNLIADGSTGLHYHRSIGDVADFGYLDDQGTLMAIKERGKLVCGVPIQQNKNFTLRMGEVATKPPSIRFLVEEEEAYDSPRDLGGAGVDMDFCRALASSIFQGLSITNADLNSCLVFDNSETTTVEKVASDGERIEFVFLEDQEEGYRKLNDGELDVIAGYPMTLQGDVREPTTGKGYSYSQPYLYGPVSKGEIVTANNRCLVTRQWDPQWSDFVQVVVMATFYAEEHHIDQENFNSMPSVNLFGPSYKRMMRDAIFAVGNYGEVYERMVEPYLPRTGGPNTLNAEADPQLSYFPGLIFTS